MHIVEFGLTLISQAQIPLHYWWEAFSTTIYLINRLPSLITQNVSPHSLIYHKEPDYTLLRPFVVLVILSSNHIINSSYSFTQSDVYFLAISTHTKDTNASIPMEKYSPQDMSFSMKIIFHAMMDFSIQEVPYKNYMKVLFHFLCILQVILKIVILHQ